MSPRTIILLFLIFFCLIAGCERKRCSGEWTHDQVKGTTPTPIREADEQPEQESFAPEQDPGHGGGGDPTPCGKTTTSGEMSQ